MAPALPLALPFLAAVNAATLLAFRIDKNRALAGGWRIRETDLLSLALIGGTPAALLARPLFRHKTRKEPFTTRLLLIAALQAGGMLGLWISAG